MQVISVPLYGKRPVCHTLDSMMNETDVPWHPQRIVERINAQVDRLGVSRTSLLKTARVPEKAIRDLEEGHWPNLRRVVKLAEAFKFPGGISEVLGLDVPEESRCDPRILHVALELVAAAMDTPSHQNPLVKEAHVVAGLASVAYQQLVELRRIDPNALDNAAALHMISVMLSSALAKFDREKS